ncbi:nuclear transport factor 2 family protein [Streptomyces sp. NPDC002758]
MSLPPAPMLRELLRIYAYAYTAAHDFSVSDRIMVDDYVLHMGTYSLSGRHEQYQPATQRQYEQFPTLGFTVHRLICNGDRAALHFTEHGHSVRVGALASWQGVSLYRWNGEQLTECRVEQDYHSRARQLATGVPQPVLPPGIDPWSQPDVPADVEAEARVRDWLEKGDWVTDPRPNWDDGNCRPQWAASTTHVLDLFSAGGAVAFHACLTGVYTGGLPDSNQFIGSEAELFVTGIVDTTKGFTGTLVSDRHSMLRRLRGRP